MSSPRRSGAEVAERDLMPLFELVDRAADRGRAAPGELGGAAGIERCAEQQCGRRDADCTYGNATGAMRQRRPQAARGRTRAAHSFARSRALSVSASWASATPMRRFV